MAMLNYLIINNVHHILTYYIMELQITINHNFYIFWIILSNPLDEGNM